MSICPLQRHWYPMQTATGVWPGCRFETNPLCWARQSVIVGRQHSSPIGFRVAADMNSNVVDFYFLVWSLSRLLCCVGSGSFLESVQTVVLCQFWLVSGVCPDCCVSSGSCLESVQTVVLCRFWLLSGVCPDCCVSSGSCLGSVQTVVLCQFWLMSGVCPDCFVVSVLAPVWSLCRLFCCVSSGSCLESVQTVVLCQFWLLSGVCADSCVVSVLAPVWSLSRLLCCVGSGSSVATALGVYSIQIVQPLAAHSLQTNRGWSAGSSSRPLIGEVKNAWICISIIPYITYGWFVTHCKLFVKCSGFSWPNFVVFSVTQSLHRRLIHDDFCLEWGSIRCDIS